MLTLHAQAKVNLALEVLGKRDDGYHEILSVLQTIELSDVISFKPADEIQVVCRDQSVDRADLLERTILSVVALLRGETGCQKGARITIDRVDIPRAAGLGSSSTDSVAVIKGLNEMWSLGLTTDELIQIASKIGSDAPFFVVGGTALARGRGEKIVPLPSPSPAWLVLLVPPITAMPGKTAGMYSLLNPDHFTDGTRAKRLADALSKGETLPFDLFCNTFEYVAYEFFDRLDKYQERFYEFGAATVHLAGAGPALFTVADSKNHGQELVERLKAGGLKAYLTRTT